MTSQYQEDVFPKKFKNQYRIESARLQGFDYGSNGAYFVTICTKNKAPYFGEIKNGIMGLSEIGCWAWKCWYDIPNHFPFVILDEFVVMPDHIHGIIFIQNSIRRDAINRVPTDDIKMGGITKNHNPMGKQTLGEIIRYFKGRTSFEIHQKIDLNFTWQPRFHDRIIRNENELNRIMKYIKNNPKNWKKDKYKC